MNYLSIFFSVFVLALSVWFFNACSGAAGKRAAIIASMNSGLPQAEQTSSEEEVKEKPTDTEIEKTLEDQTKAEKKTKPDDPKEFNYFPYDLQLDTIAFMSCENNNYFTVKAGSFFSRSGVRLSEYFLKRRSLGNLKDLIESSTKHQANARLSIAHKLDLTATLQGSTVFFPVRLNRLIDDLISVGNNRINEVSGSFIEAKIAKGDHAPLYARAFNGNYRLLLTYVGGKQGGTLHKTGGEWGVDVYGRVYSIRTTEHRDARYILNSVSEEKLPEGSSQTGWVCPESLKLEIRRHVKNTFKSQEWYNAQTESYKKKYSTLQAALDASDPAHKAPANEASCADSSSGGAALKVAAAVLDEQWNINIGDKCISPKSSSVFCYNKITNREYPFERVAVRDSNCSGSSRKAYCPHFLSICIRKN